MPPLQNPFLKEKYNLHNAPEVAVAAKRTEIRTKLKTGEAERVAQDPEARIQNYLNRFTEITERKDPKHRERGLEALKHVLHKKFVIKPNEVPEGYFEDQRRLAREQGHGDIEISDEARDQLTEVIIADQESSLDKWVDYLSSPDATYPDWLKYWATRSITTMGEYDKEKHAFTKRSKGTTKPFPDLDREALAYVLDAVEKKYSEGYQAKEKELTKLTQQAKATKRKANSEFTDDFEALQSRISTLKTEQQQHITGNLDLNEADLEAFAKGFDANDFAKLYAWAIEQVTPAWHRLVYCRRINGSSPTSSRRLLCLLLHVRRRRTHGASCRHSYGGGSYRRSTWHCRPAESRPPYRPSRAREAERIS
jgi:hypothetical protein